MLRTGNFLEGSGFLPTDGPSYPIGVKCEIRTRKVTMALMTANLVDVIFFVTLQYFNLKCISYN